MRVSFEPVGDLAGFRKLVRIAGADEVDGAVVFGDLSSTFSYKEET